MHYITRDSHLASRDSHLAIMFSCCFPNRATLIMLAQDASAKQILTLAPISSNAAMARQTVPVSSDDSSYLLQRFADIADLRPRSPMRPMPPGKRQRQQCQILQTPSAKDPSPIDLPPAPADVTPASGASARRQRQTLSPADLPPAQANVTPAVAPAPRDLAPNTKPTDLAPALKYSKPAPAPTGFLGDAHLKPFAPPADRPLPPIYPPPAHVLPRQRLTPVSLPTPAPTYDTQVTILQVASSCSSSN